jgi:hypothetical protein
MTRIDEKVRRKQPDDWNIAAKPVGRFNIATFKHLIDKKDLTTGRKYAHKHLDKLGIGSSRAGFLLTSQKVLKVALDERGMAQNEAEVNLYTNPLTKPVITKIYDFDSEYQWIVCELVDNFDTDDQFRKAIGMVPQNISGFRIDTIMRKLGETDHNSDEFNELVEKFDEGTNPNFREFMLGLNVLMTKFGLPSFDMYDQHFGRTIDGRIVLLDYGIDKDVLKKWY